MGLHDAAEMLDAAKAQGVIDEREIARLRAELNAAEQLIAKQAETLQEQSGLFFCAGETHAVLSLARRDLEQTLDRVRAEVRPYIGDLNEDPAGALAAAVLEIIGTQQPSSVDEHDRHA